MNSTRQYDKPVEMFFAPARYHYISLSSLPIEGAVLRRDSIETPCTNRGVKPLLQSIGIYLKLPDTSPC
jgi:hypothetical protein